MTDFNKLLSEQMKDPEFRKEYEALEPEFTIKRAMIDARKAKGLTQKELSNSDQSVYTDLLAAQCERASGYQGRNGRAILQDMDQIMIHDISNKEAAGLYLVARRAYGHGCIAIPVKPGNALAEFVSLLNEETAGTDIQIIGISRPAAYGEYAPYTILGSASSFHDAVSAMKTAVTVEKLTYKGYVGTVQYSMKDALLFGSILDVHGSLNFHGKNLCELEKSFHDCVDSYLDFCVSSGKETDSRC